MQATVSVAPTSMSDAVAERSPCVARPARRPAKAKGSTAGPCSASSERRGREKAVSPRHRMLPLNLMDASSPGSCSVSTYMQG